MSEERVLSDFVWTPERGENEPELRSISWNNLLLSDEVYGGKFLTASEVRITPETALQSTVFLACCRIISETVAGLPILVHRRLKSGHEEIAGDVPLAHVLGFSPNQWQTKFEFFEQMVMALTCWGNSYTEVRSGRYGSVTELNNLHPSRMRVERLENGRLKYSYNDPQTGRLLEYTQDQIMHVRWTPEPDGVKGMVPVEVSRDAIALARACEIYASKFWANMGRPGVVLQTDGALSAETAERLRDNWERIHRGVQNAYKTAVLTNGLKVESFGATNNDSQFLEVRKFQCEEIARCFRLPLHLIQGQSGGNLEIQGQEFLNYTLMPWLTRIEQSISRSLIYDDDTYYAKFDTKGLLRGDSGSRASYYSTMLNLGILSINECRRAEGLGPLGPEADKHLVAMNLQPLEEAVKPKPDPSMMPPPGVPPKAPGVPPSLSEVKTGKAPMESPKGEDSAKRAESRELTPQDAELEEAQAEIADEEGKWSKESAHYIEKNPFAARGIKCHNCTHYVEEGGCKIVSGLIGGDAICKLWVIPQEKITKDPEQRSYCPTGPGGGIDNSCGSGTAAESPPSLDWKSESGELDWGRDELQESPPVSGGGDLRSFWVNDTESLVSIMDDVKASLDDVVAIGGGVRRGGDVEIHADDGGMTVACKLPVATSGLQREGIVSVEATIFPTDDGPVVAYDNLSLEGVSKTKPGLVPRVTSLMLQRMAESMSRAEELGFVQAETDAVGSAGSSLKGYRLWPQFGFDGDVPSPVAKTASEYPTLPDDIRAKAASQTLKVQELIATREGERFWDDFGMDIGLTFDFRDKSSLGYARYQEMKAKTSRLRDRNASRSFVADIASRAYCPTGKGGGVKNDCGSKDGGSVTADEAKEKFERYRPFKSVGDSKNSDYIRIPSDEEISSVLLDADVQQSKIGASRELPDKTPVALRIDIPAWNRSEGKTYVVTVHEGKNPDNKKPFGKVLGYDSMALLSGPVRFSSNDEDRAQEVAEGNSKTPLATVNGSFSKSRAIPEDIDSWTPVGYDPQKAVYFYDKKSGQEVVSGTDALSVGNTVFTRDPKYGKRNAKTHYRSADEMMAVGFWGLESRAFCPTGDDGGIDNSCSSKDGDKGGDEPSPEGGCPKPCHTTDVHADENEDGVTDAARVGVPAMEVPPPPGIPRIPNLDERARQAEEAFVSSFEKDPDGISEKFRDLVVSQGDPPTFGTDDAKCLTTAWSESDPEARAENRATLNTALHQCANAVAKRSFLQHLDTLEKGDSIMVTVGGCGAGKGFALKNNPAALELKSQSKAVWDSAGDQNATENPWIQSEAEKRGLSVTYVYVHADPKVQWADPDRGVVKRASDPKDGRMVDAKVFADSYAIGARNHHAFHQANKDNPNARFVFLDNTGKPKEIPGVPKEARELDAGELAAFATSAVEKSQAPERVKKGALQGRRIWKK